MSSVDVTGHLNVPRSVTIVSFSHGPVIEYEKKVFIVILVLCDYLLTTH